MKNSEIFERLGFAFFDDKTATERPFSWAYWREIARQKVRHQAQFWFPAIVFFTYLLWLGEPVNSFFDELGVPEMLLISMGLAAFAAGGAKAFWVWLSARLYPLLDANPTPQDYIKDDYRLPVRPRQSDSETPFLIVGEEHPSREYRWDGSYAVTYSLKEEYSAFPEWCAIPASGLVCGTYVLGSIGSGKTSYFLKPSVFQLFHHHSRPGGLIMDSKASLVDPLQNELETAGRILDFLPVGPSRSTTYNPLHSPESDPATIAENVVKVLENVNKSPYGADARWIRYGVSSLCESGIGLLRLLCNGYVTPASLKALIDQIVLGCAGQENPVDFAKNKIESLFEDIELTSEDEQKLAFFKAMLVSRCSEDEKFRNIYMTELFNILTPLSAPGLIEIFSPKLENLNMPSWIEIINLGKIVCLDCNAQTRPNLSIILGMFLKLGYENAMLARVDQMRSGLVNSTRYMVLCIDEYQDFASPMDAPYLAKCRESKSMTFFATQGHVSIEQIVGKEAADVILQNLLTRLILKQSMPSWASEFLGKEEVQDVNRNITENVAEASLQATGKFSGNSSVSESLSVSRREKVKVSTEILRAMPVGQCLAEVFDGAHTHPLKRVFLRPFFAPDTRHSQLLKS